MKFKWQSWTSLGLLTCGMALLTYCSSCSYINQKIGVANDHPIEQLTEKVIDQLIEDQTGVDSNIDLTP